MLNITYEQGKELLDFIFFEEAYDFYNIFHENVLTIKLLQFLGEQ